MSTIHQLCTFRLGELTFGIDVHTIQEVIRFQEMTRVPLAPAAVHGLINLRGQIVTAIDLRTRLSLPARTGEELPTNVVVRTGEGAVSLLVDEIGDVVEIDAEFYEPPPETLDPHARGLVSGVYKMKEFLLLVLDVDTATTIASPLQETTA